MLTRALSYGLLAVSVAIGALHAQAPSQTVEKKVDRGTAYYHFSMGHLYAELAGQYGNRGDYLNKAIDHYKQALKADPSATMLSEDLSELYIQAGRLREAVTDAEEALKQNPNDLNARRILGRIYTRMIGDSQANRINEEMLKKAIEQYSKVTEKDASDVRSLITLGRLHKVAQNSVEAERAYKKVLELEPNNEDALTGLAMVYGDLGDNKRASEMLNKAAEKNPSLRTLAALASAYEQMRDYKQAANTLRKALELAPQNGELKRALAQNLMLADNLDEALSLYQQLVQEDARDAGSQLRISQIYRQKKDFVKAHQASAKAREIDPNNLEARYNEVNLLEAEGKTQEAIEEMKAMLSSTSKRNYQPGERTNRVVLVERLGFLYRNAEMYNEAVATFRQMEELDSDQGPRSRVHVIETLRTAKDYNKAWTEAESAVKKYPDDRAVRTVHAYVAADVGRGDEAAKGMRKLLDGKNDRETWVALAQVYERTKNYGEMSKALDQAEKLSEDRDDKENIHFMRGAMLEKMKQFDAAETEFRKVLEMNPNNASALNYLGYMFADRNIRLTEAQQMIQKALDLDPGNGAYLDSLGWVLYRLGRLEDAEDNLKRAIQKTSKDPTVHEHLGDVYMKQGKVKEAIAQWQKSLHEWETSSQSEQDPAEVAKIQKKLDGAKSRQAKETGKK